MNIDAQLLELYKEWKRLTEREGYAILESNWAEVRACQQTKQQLQPAIIRASDQLKNINQTAEIEDRIRQCINELILLESRNSEALGQRLEAAEKERDGLNSTSHRLKRLQRSYTSSRSPAWDQYS